MQWFVTGGGEGLGVGVRDGVLLGGVSGESMRARGVVLVVRSKDMC